MKKLTKTQKKIYKIFDGNKIYSLTEATKIVKEISSYTYFNSSIDIAIRLGVDQRKANQIIRGIVKLPFGSGKDFRVLALVESDKQLEAKEAGADFIGYEEFLTKINEGWTEIDIIITTPTMMPKLGRLGKILGPKKLMPNPKSGTVTIEIGKAIKEVKLGKIDFRADRNGIVHSTIGKASFKAFQIKENSIELVNTLHHIKPSSIKGIYIKSIFLSGTMTPGVRVDVNSISY
ncbi:50S ribosomal protein L1 [Candidatus Uzinura diaspidicola str. ASNER]|uniref:Large ribosomal subunit protein uL1 n=1 Tax=Candidatus Uzinura diaspidicola str. ASNER TaxID=1133592 RepID=L7VJD4_9FLAO|nr:50S ribosomal protein L1 [Candidatus Uzinura diaspidicola str. ASNER]